LNHRTEQFLDLLDRHKRLIYKVVNAYCKNKALHEDLTQEIILRLWSSFDRYDRQFKESTWIYRIAEIVGISPTNVGTKLTRIKKILRKKINQN